MFQQTQDPFASLYAVSGRGSYVLTLQTLSSLRPDFLRLTRVASVCLLMVIKLAMPFNNSAGFFVLISTSVIQFLDTIMYY